MTDNVAMTLRLPKELHRVFMSVCQDRGLSANLVIREMVKGYVSENKQIDILKGLK